jgi:uncharacterized protein (DUF3084 family)
MTSRCLISISPDFFCFGRTFRTQFVGHPLALRLHSTIDRITDLTVGRLNALHTDINDLNANLARILVGLLRASASMILSRSPDTTSCTVRLPNSSRRPALTVCVQARARTRFIALHRNVIKLRIDDAPLDVRNRPERSSSPR